MPNTPAPAYAEDLALALRIADAADAVTMDRFNARDLVVETGHWFAGKAILISTGRITRISYEESTVFVNLTKADIQRTAENEVAKTHVRKH